MVFTIELVDGTTLEIEADSHDEALAQLLDDDEVS